MSKEIDEILDKYLWVPGLGQEELFKYMHTSLAQAIENLIKEQKLQLLKEVEESVMGALKDVKSPLRKDSEDGLVYEDGYSLIINSYGVFHDDADEVLKLIADTHAELRTQIIKSIKELRDGL